MPSPQPERRARTLTDEDIASLMARIDESWLKHCEVLGYDVSTPTARAEIHADHSFLRNMRVGTARAKIAAWGAGISTFVGAALYMFWLTIKTALSAKGAG